jgi:AcrR family transcriptional regulator
LSAEHVQEARRRAIRRDALVNREKILAAAAELMAQRGRNVPLAEIAEAAGVGVGTLYRGYPDRTALLHALEHRAYDLLLETLCSIDQSGQTGADAIETYLHECLELSDQLILPLHGAPPLTDDSAVAAREQINAALNRYLADGRANGGICADVNATDVIMCAAMVSHPLPHGPNWTSIARRHINLFIRGIRAPADQPLPGSAVTQHDIERTFTAKVGGGRDRDQLPT